MRSSRIIKLLLVDAHRVVSEGLRRLFESQPDIEVFDGDETGRNVLQLTRELEPDVVVIDVNMSETYHRQRFTFLVPIFAPEVFLTLQRVTFCALSNMLPRIAKG